MATVAAPTYGTLLAGAVSSVEVQSQYLHNQTWNDEVLKQTDEAPTFMQQLVALGMVENGGTMLPTWHHLETDTYANGFTVDAAVAPAINTGYTLTIAAGNYNAQGESIALEGNHVVFPNGTEGIITAVTRVANAWTIDVDPHSHPQLPATAQGDALIMLANSVGEANTPDISYLKKDVYAYDHSTQVINYKTDVTDFLMAYNENTKLSANVVDLPAPWINGTVKSWVSYELTEWFKARMMEIAATKFLGHRSGVGGALSLANPRYADGIIPFLDAGGIQAITPGTMTANWLELLAQGFIDAKHGAVDHRMLVGRGFWTKMVTYLLSLPGQDMRQGVSNKVYDMAITGLNGLAGHNFSMNLVDAFDNPLTFLPAHGYSDVAIVVPNATDAYADTLTGKRVKLIRLVYQEAFNSMGGNLGSGMIKWALRTGITFTPPGQQPTLQRDAMEMEFKLVCGLDLRQPSRFAISR